MIIIIKSIITGLDFIISISLAILLFFFLPIQTNVFLVKDIYGVAIPILSIIFPVFFASLAIIITSSRDDFAMFLQERGYFENLLSLFKFTLIIIFFSLLLTIFLYIHASILINNGIKTQYKLYLILFSFFFLYSLLSSLNAILGVIKYAKNRIQFEQQTPNDTANRGR